MIRMFVRHNVDDYDRWRAAYDNFDEERQGMGVVDDAVYRNTQFPNDVTVTHDFDSIDAGRAFASSARLREIMGEAGVASEPVIWFTSEA